MTLGDAQDLLARCGQTMKPPVAGKLVHAWKGWCDHEATPPVIVFTHEQYDEARDIVVAEVARLNQE